MSVSVSLIEENGRKEGRQEAKTMRKREGMRRMRMRMMNMMNMMMDMMDMMVGMSMEEKVHLEREEKSCYSSIIHHPLAIHPSSVVNHHRKAESSSAKSMGGRVDGMIDEKKKRSMIDRRSTLLFRHIALGHE